MNARTRPDPAGKRRGHAGGGLTVAGIVRTDRDLRTLARLLEPGDIAVIEAPDLDYESAELLAARRPAAVLNAAESDTGRVANLGSRVLLAAGIPLIDSFGADVLALRDGQRVTIADGLVSVDGVAVGEGEVVTEGSVARAHQNARTARRFQLDAVGSATSELLATEGSLLLDGEGLPELTTSFKGRPVLVVGGRGQAGAELAGIRQWIRESRPVIVGVEAGAEIMQAAGLVPDLVLGQLDDVGDVSIQRAPALVLHTVPGAVSRGRMRVEELGRDYASVTSAVPSATLAVLLAAHGEASVVVTAGVPDTPAQVLDAGRVAAGATALARLELGGRLVSARALPALVRPRIRTRQLVLLGLMALLAIALALLTTPVGQAALGIGPDWLSELFGAASKEDLWSTSVIT